MSDRYAPKMSDLRVTRPAPTVSVAVKRSYGPNLGDEHETTVSRTGKRVRIYQQNKVDMNLGLEEARMLAAGILAVVGWEDTDDA